MFIQKGDYFESCVLLDSLSDYFSESYGYSSDYTAQYDMLYGKYLLLSGDFSGSEYYLNKAIHLLEKAPNSELAEDAIALLGECEILSGNRENGLKKVRYAASLSLKNRSFDVSKSLTRRLNLAEMLIFYGNLDEARAVIENLPWQFTGMCSEIVEPLNLRYQKLVSLIDGIKT